MACQCDRTYCGPAYWRTWRTGVPIHLERCPNSVAIAGNNVEYFAQIDHDLLAWPYKANRMNVQSNCETMKNTFAGNGRKDKGMPYASFVTFHYRIATSVIKPKRQPAKIHGLPTDYNCDSVEGITLIVEKVSGLGMNAELVFVHQVLVCQCRRPTAKKRW